MAIAAMTAAMAIPAGVWHHTLLRKRASAINSVRQLIDSRTMAISPQTSLRRNKGRTVISGRQPHAQRPLSTITSSSGSNSTSFNSDERADVTNPSPAFLALVLGYFWIVLDHSILSPCLSLVA